MRKLRRQEKKRKEKKSECVLSGCRCPLEEGHTKLPAVLYVGDSHDGVDGAQLLHSLHRVTPDETERDSAPSEFTAARV